MNTYGSIPYIEILNSSNLYFTRAFETAITPETDLTPETLFILWISDVDNFAEILVPEGSKEGLDNLDSAILESISKGESKLDALRGDINIRSEDLAFHLEKLYVQSYIDYYIRSSELYLTLTENGFNEIGSVKKKEKSKDIEETIDETEKPEEKYESKMQEEMPENESIQTKLTNIEESDEDMMTKRVRTKREHYWGKYKIYYFLAIILILIVLGLIYFFLMG